MENVILEDWDYKREKYESNFYLKFLGFTRICVPSRNFFNYIAEEDPAIVKYSEKFSTIEEFLLDLQEIGYKIEEKFLSFAKGVEERYFIPEVIE